MPTGMVYSSFFSVLFVFRWSKAARLNAGVHGVPSFFLKRSDLRFEGPVC